MQFRQIGSTDVSASAVTLGTWAIGGWMWGGCDESAAIRTIQTALDVGMTTIDTAPIYGFGRSEEIVGKALRGRPRDSFTLLTKCALAWSVAEFPPNYGEFHCYANDEGRADKMEKYVVHRVVRPEAIRRGVENSLRRLKIEHIDLMQVHHCADKTTPIADAMGTLEDLRREGKIRAIGISNATPAQFDEYCAAGSLDADQERYSMLDRAVEKNGLLDACRERGVTFLAYSPLENGLLTGKLDPNREYGRGDLRANDPKFSKANVERVNAALAALGEVARKYNLTPGQFAAAWVISRYEKAIVLCGARTPEQVLANAPAGDVALSADDFAATDEILRDFGLI
ncbi:MAG: aldo/keto reductase [Thermoguttaceae bacterium]|nr:aldo/keto reductase [Thermoguttaceae bacterium]